MRAVLSGAVLLVLVVGASSIAGAGDTTTTSTTAAARKVFVCKYTGTPGVDEVLQGGGNPISIDWQPGRDPGQFFNDAQGRSYVIAFDTGQPEPDVSGCPPPQGGTTTTSTTISPSSTTTTPPTSSTSTTSPTTTLPPSTTSTTLVITTLVITTTTTSTTSSSTLPTTTGPSTTSTSSTTTTPSTTTTSSSSPPSTSTLPETFTFGAAATVCVAEVPTIRIVFQNQFPDLAGLPGFLTMTDVNGNVVSEQVVIYEPGTTVDLLYPGTSVNPDGSIDDVPGWILTDDGFWIRDPSDEFLREGITLTYTVNPTATAGVTYPPESSTCANPDGPFGPSPTPTPTVLLPATR